MSKYILGISAYYHDSAAALIKDGEIIAAAQEERFSRIKGDASFPHNAIGYCLDEEKISLEDLSDIIFYENPIIKFERLMATYYLTVPKGIKSFLSSMPKWLTKNLWMDAQIKRELGIKRKINFCEHHISHAASAFYPSPFEKAAILTIDGVGEWATTTWGIGEGERIVLKKELRFPNSFGLLYSAITYFTGFKINSGEYKLMGLAPYGEPIYADIIRDRLIHVNEDGTIILNQEYFAYTTSLKMINKKFEDLFGGPPRKPETRITKREMDIASSIQEIFNEVILKMVNHVYEESGCENLVLSGGVALNVVTMGYISKYSKFHKIWIQPAAGDAGGSIGAALWYWYTKCSGKRETNPLDSMKGSFLGPNIEPDSEADSETLQKMGGVWQLFSDDDLAEKLAELLHQGYIIGIARGRMEWGPRALGNRSIIGSAVDETMQSRMNLKIKFRESFRPFAPMVLEKDAEEYFEIAQESPYMLLVYNVLKSRRINYKKEKINEDLTELINCKRSDIPAVTHMDYSARVQTIDEERNPFMYSVIENYKSISGYSVIVNTSFNVRGEPIVNTAEDAYRCFMATEMDYLVIGNRLFSKAEQGNKALDEKGRMEWLRRFELD